MTRRWSVLTGAALLACGHTQTNASSDGGAGGGGGSAAAGGGGSAAVGGGGSAAAGATGGFSPRKPIPCGEVKVPAEKACDGIRDCQLGNDESGCPLYFCKDGSSRVGRKVCDGEPDCPESEDEAEDQCDSVPTGFVCPSGGRIARREVCDGKPDCDDAADEAVCPAFLCANGAQAIAAILECDQTQDCADGSDEESCWVP